MILEQNSGLIHVSKMQITNSHKYDLGLLIEPWGEELLIPQGMTYEVLAESPSVGCLELEIGEKAITIYGWVGSVVSVFSRGQRLMHCDIAPPPTPPPLKS